MAKNKYATEYPVILKEKAKAAGIKVKKADYRFLDYFMLIQEEAEHPDVKLDLLEESKELVETALDAMIVASSRRYARWLCKELLEIGAQAEIA